jgi:hypothetical protein
MPRPPFRNTPMFALLVVLMAPAWVNGQKQQSDAERSALSALAKLDKGWKPYENKPNLRDPRWKVQMRALVQVVRAGTAALPVLRATAKKGSPWSDSSRTFAAKVLKVVQGPAVVRNAIAKYDLAKMDTARQGKPAPNFALPDAGGEPYCLSQFRGKKVVVLTFVAADT